MDGEQKDKAPKDIQWHPAFISAMNLELLENKNDLVFEREYNLNTKPLEIDLLIIKKEKTFPYGMRSVIFSGSIMFWNTKRRATA